MSAYWRREIAFQLVPFNQVSTASASSECPEERTRRADLFCSSTALGKAPRSLDPDTLHTKSRKESKKQTQLLSAAANHNAREVGKAASPAWTFCFILIPGLRIQLSEIKPTVGWLWQNGHKGQIIQSTGRHQQLKQASRGYGASGKRISGGDDDVFGCRLQTKNKWRTNVEKMWIDCQMNLQWESRQSHFKIIHCVPGIEGRQGPRGEKRIWDEPNPSRVIAAAR